MYLTENERMHVASDSTVPSSGKFENPRVMREILVFSMREILVFSTYEKQETRVDFA